MQRTGNLAVLGVILLAIGGFMLYGDEIFDEEIEINNEGCNDLGGNCMGSGECTQFGGEVLHPDEECGAGTICCDVSDSSGGGGGGGGGYVR